MPVVCKNFSANVEKSLFTLLVAQVKGVRNYLVFLINSIFYFSERTFSSSAFRWLLFVSPAGCHYK